MSGTTRQLNAAPWQPCAPLGEQGTWLLEASAGTGKTWQLASLAARLVVEQRVPVERLLMITFTIAAAAELRDRVRKRLAEVRDTLAALLEGQQSVVASLQDVAADPVLRHLCWQPEGSALLSNDERAKRLQAVTIALSSFDLAQITTIHGFCQRALETLAFESGQDAGLTLVEDLGGIRQELVHDALAEVQATATAEQWKQWQDANWDARTLQKTAELACSVSGQVIEPAVNEHQPLGAWLDRLEQARQRFAEVWSTHGEQLVLDLRDEHARRPGDFKAHYAPEAIDKSAEQVRTWLRGETRTPTAALKKFTPEGLNGAVRVRRPPLLHDAGPELERALAALQDAKRGRAPLATFAHRARREVEQRLLASRQISFDAMLTRLAGAIEAELEGGGPRPLRDALAAQFDAVFVDEFQDTDIAQWTVLREAFGAVSGKRLFLVGDPKQAIYGFRGADVHVYLAAKQTAPQHPERGCGGRFTMTTNYRSDGPLVRALNGLWRPDSGAFGPRAMDYVQVEVPTAHSGWQLRGLPDVASDRAPPRPRKPLELRWLDDGAHDSGARIPIGDRNDGAKAAAAACAGEIRALLDSGATLHPRGGDPGAPGRPLRPGDIAVLVHRHRDAAAIKRALARHGIMAVATGTGTVLKSPVAAWLLQLLDALARPGYEAAARAVAVSPLLGYSLTELAEALDEAEGVSVPPLDEPEDPWRPGLPTLRWTAFRGHLQRWSQRWSTRRFAGVVGEVLATYNVVPRLLRLQNGERFGTDLRHLFELCHVAERQHHFSPAGLADWLRKRRDEGDGDRVEANVPRLESDAAAVQVMTTFGAKGLQFPVVMAPFAWASKHVQDRGQPIVVHPDDGEEASAGRPVLDVRAKTDPARQRHFARYKQEQLEEGLRLLYVELTRGQHHCVLWLGNVGSRAADAAANAIVLRDREGAPDPFADSALAEAACRGIPTSSRADLDKFWRELSAAHQRLCVHLDALASEVPELGWAFSQRPEHAPQTRWAPPAARHEALATAVFDHRRHLGAPWQRASYTSMAAGRGFEDQQLALQALDPSERERAALRPGADEPDATEQPQPDPGVAETGAARPPTPLPLGRMWGGKAVGTWVHAVLEHLNFAPHRALDAADLEAWRGDPVEQEVNAAKSPYSRRSSGHAAPAAALALAAEQGAALGHRRHDDHLALVLALPHVLTTRLGRCGSAAGPLAQHGYRPAHGLRLTDIPLVDRVDEMAFDLSICGGERWRPDALGAPAPVIDADAVTAALRLRLDDPEQAGWDGRGWLNELVQRAEQSRHDPSPWSILPRIAGLLTGFVDLTFRAVSADGQRRYYIADYKTNRLLVRGGPETTPDDYDRAGLAWSMAHSNYHLQSLLYSLALHRLLRDRLPDYRYDDHVGGHLYLYLRGMAPQLDGPGDSASEHARGVYFDRWPAAVVEALHAALDPTLRRGAAARCA